MGSHAAHTVAKIPGVPAYAHPAMALLVDERIGPALGILRIVEEAGAAAVMDAEIPVDWGAALFGSVTRSRLGVHAPDVDVVLPLRFRPGTRGASCQTAHQAAAAATEALLHVLLDALRAQPGVAVLELHAVWEEPRAHAGARPAHQRAVFSPIDAALGRTTTGVGEVSLADAVRRASQLKIGCIAGESDGGVFVDIAIDRSLVAPGGVADVHVNALTPWSGKVAASERSAGVLAGMEEELATLFPARYAPGAFASDMYRSVLGDMAARRRGAVKACKMIALLSALARDEGTLAALRDVLARVGDAHAHAWRGVAAVKAAAAGRAPAQRCAGLARRACDDLLRALNVPGDALEAHATRLESARMLIGDTPAPAAWAALHGACVGVIEDADRTVHPRLMAIDGLGRLLGPSLVAALAANVCAPRG